MPTMTVKKGQHDFKPNSIPVPIGARRLYFKMWLYDDCWYDTLGVDNFDFNKAVGLYKFYDFKKNQNAVMIGWRPKLNQKGYFECVPYENVDGSNVANEQKMIIVKAEQEIFGYFEPTPNGWQLWIKTGELSEFYLWHQAKLNAKKVGKIEGWFGGNQTAPETMTMYLNFRN